MKRWRLLQPLLQVQVRLSAKQGNLFSFFRVVQFGVQAQHPLIQKDKQKAYIDKQHLVGTWTPSYRYVQEK